jgi:putative tryptophan/tyrosine transport system substrate-binding protein
MASHIERRKFLATLGSAAAWPVAARAQQTAMPVVGFFYSGTLTDVPHFVTAFRQGLKEAGFLRTRLNGGDMACVPRAPTR